jgi:hypothetical protein
MESVNLRITSIDDEQNVTDRGAGFAWHIAVTSVHAHHARGMSPFLFPGAVGFPVGARW